MPRRKKLSRDEKRAERERKLAFIIIEVARATGDGSVVNQQEVKEELRRRWSVALPDSTLSGYVTQLSSNSTGRAWLKKDGQRVTLASEEKILTDSRAIKGLLLASRLAESDNDDRISMTAWAEQCKRLYSFTPETCRKYLKDYERCGYMRENGRGNQPQLHVRRVKQDQFYLRQAARANLKARPLGQD